MPHCNSYDIFCYLYNMESLEEAKESTKDLVTTRDYYAVSKGSHNGVVKRIRRDATRGEELESFRETLLRAADNQIATYSPYELAHHFVDYIDWNEANPLKKPQLIQKLGDTVDVPVGRPLSIKRFCMFLGISSSTYHKYKEKQSHANIIAVIDDAIYTNKYEGAAVNLFNTQIIMRDLGIGDSVTHVMDDRRKSVQELFPNIEDAQIIEETSPEEVRRINDNAHGN